MLNRSLKEKLAYYPTGYPSSTLYVDMGVWNSLAKDDQEILLRHVDHVEAYPDVEVQGVKLIWDIDPDYFTLDQELYWAVAYLAQDESDMNKHVKLLRMLWNSRREGRQLENEEYLRQAMLEKGKALHLYPWVEKGMHLADFEDPKFSPMTTMEHTSNWFDRERFAESMHELYFLRPTEQDNVWIRQYTHLILSKSDKTCNDPMHCLQASTTAIKKYIASQKLNAFATASDTWTWRAVVTSHIEQSLQEPVQPLSAEPMVDQCKEDKPEQHVGMDGREAEPLPPTPLLDGDRRKTRRQAKMESLVIPSAATLSSSDEEEPVVHRSGRRAKKSRSTECA